MADFALGFIVGIVVDKITEVVLDGAKTICLSTLRFNRIVKNFEYRVEFLELEIKKDLIEDQNSTNLRRLTEKAKALLNKCRKVGGRKNPITRSYYTWKIHKLVKDLTIHVEILGSRIQWEIFELVRTARIGRTNMQRIDSTDVQILMIRQFQIAHFKTELDALLKANPLKDVSSINPNDVVDYDAETETEALSFHVGLDVPSINPNDVGLHVECKAEIEEVKRGHTNISQLSQGLVTLIQAIQCKNEKGPERTEESKWHGMGVDGVTEDFKLTPELQILATDLVQRKMRQFRAWIGDPDDGRRDLKVFVASKKWFKDLMTPGMWLTDTHVDAFLYFVRNNPQCHPQSLTHSCTVLDTVFWSWMTGRWTSFQNNPTSYEWDSDILDYPLGKSPQFTRRWSEVDYLYIPVNITNQHWVAVCVDLMRRKFTIYDSMQSASQDEFICDMLNPLATMFPSLLIQSGFYEMRPELSPLNTPFQVVHQAESNPQQSESGDCGVFMLRFVEYLSSGQQLCFKDKDIPAFRERMAFRLFAMSHDIGGNNTLVS